ncbi:NucA/NucB deoxyribonuclease domain-containing protein [Streptomyces anulatus]|uniref:NucA/NucB deoxyribonuclease domain-containing protein n=1 Tax=Streptomyces anulatus TaxID=1892 RepID=UPI003325A07B
MHRLVPAAGALESTRFDANRSAVTSTCNSPSMPGRPGPDDELDCDEFPMASTFEGAARKDYEGSQYTDEFSVRYIDRVENQEAGRRLGAWYDNDRILNNDAFILVVGN